MKLTKRTRDILIYLGLNGRNRPPIGTQMARNIGITYSHTNKLVNELIENGFIFNESKGRTKKIYLTDKGKKAVAGLLLLKEVGLE